jgi:hypothetical protein
MMRDKKTPKDKRILSLLGGSALFGYLGCQIPGAGPTDPALSAPKDSVVIASKDTLKSISVRPDPMPLTETVIVRNGPTLGEACPPVPEFGKAVCSVDGVILSCLRGVMVEGYISPERYCIKGDTVLRYRHFGFTGIEKAGARRGKARLVRANPALVRIA